MEEYKGEYSSMKATVAKQVQFRDSVKLLKGNVTNGSAEILKR